MKLDPIWGYFGISDHNLILNSSGDTHGLSWAPSPNFRYNMLYWYNKKKLDTGVEGLSGFSTDKCPDVVVFCCPRAVGSVHGSLMTTFKCRHDDF